MPTAGYTYLVITDGTTTVTLEDGSGGATNYRLLAGSWSPAVAGLRRSQLGGAGPYSDVTESFDISIRDTTVSGCLDKAQTLHNLLIQADRFYNGEGVSPVVVKFVPKGATVSSVANPLQALILGAASGDNTGSALSMGPVWDSVARNYNLAPVHVSFVRRGAWLHTTSTQTSAATNNGTAVTLTTMAAAKVYSPTDVGVTNFGSAASYSNGYVIVNNTTGGLQQLSCAAMTGFADYSTVNEAAKYATYTNVLRFTPTVTTERVSNVTSGASNVETLWHVFMSARNNSATTTFRVRVGFTLWQPSYTPYVTIPVSTSPTWYYCGLVYGRINAVGGSVRVACMASAAAGTLDLDAINLVDAYNTNNRAISIRQTGNAISSPITIKHYASSALIPNIVDNTSALLSHAGDAFVPTIGDTNLVVLQTGSDVSTDAWRAAAAGAVVQNQITGTRTASYLIAQ